MIHFDPFLQQKFTFFCFPKSLAELKVLACLGRNYPKRGRKHTQKYEKGINKTFKNRRETWQNFSKTALNPRILVKENHWWVLDSWFPSEVMAKLDSIRWLLHTRLVWDVYIWRMRRIFSPLRNCWSRKFPTKLAIVMPNGRQLGMKTYNFWSSRRGFRQNLISFAKFPPKTRFWWNSGGFRSLQKCQIGMLPHQICHQTQFFLQNSPASTLPL